MIEIQCPSAETLRQWTNGEIDEATANELTEHLRQCTDCQAILADQDHRDSDSLIQQLKAADPLLDFRSEHDCQQASILAMGAITGQAMEETHTAMPVFPKEMEDYRLLELIASGGMGKVYRAHHQRLGRDVAIKIISGRRLADANASLRFEQEIRALGRLSHPNIVSALDARQADGSPILIMEYVDGLDLSQIVKRLGALPASSVAAIGRAVAAAIAYASSHGLVHRDIKPSNIMINGKGEVKLLDLGLARIQLDGHVAPEWTGTGLAVGTPDYMSPEQINDSQTINSQSDLYSLGCTLYRLLVGHAPYGGSKYRSNFEKLAAHVSESPIRIPNAKSQYPAELVSIIERLLSKSPEDRPDSAQTIALELEKLSTGADLAGLLAMARKLQTADNSQTPSSSEQLVPSASRGSGRVGSIVRWTTALGGIPVGILLGIWLTVHNSDGTQNKVQLPGNANATIDDKGNVQVDMANAGNTQGGSAQAAEIPNNFQSAGVPNNNPDEKSNVSNSAISPSDFAAALRRTGTNKPLFRGNTYDEWIRVLETERSGDTVVLAGQAVIELADSSHQDQALDLIFKKSRELGGILYGDNDDSQRWMSMLKGYIFKWVPEPFIEAALKEIPEGNGKSIAMILTITRLNTEMEKSLFRRSTAQYQPQWKTLIQKLADVDKNIIPTNSDDQNYLLTELLIVSDRLGIPFAELPSYKLRAISSECWAKAQKKRLSYHPYNSFFRGPDTPWLPYWRTIPPSQIDKRFMVRALFANLDNCRSDAEGILSRFEKFSPEEQKDICEFLAERYEDFQFKNSFNSTLWSLMFDALHRCSSLDKSAVEQAAQIVQDAHIESSGTGHLPKLYVSKFKELLGVTKSNVAANVGLESGSQFPLNASGNQPNVSEQEISDLIKAGNTDQSRFRGHTFDEWAAVLPSERSAAMQKVIVEALISLAESPEQKSHAMRLIFEKCRKLGGLGVGGGSDSGNWMELLHNDRMRRLFPHPFVDEAITELKDGNVESFMAIVSICQSNPAEYFLEPALPGGKNERVLSPKWQDFVAALSSAHMRWKSANGYPSAEFDWIPDWILTLAARLDFPYAKLDPPLQTASKEAWTILAQATPTPIAAVGATARDAAWVPYWKTLPQQDNKKSLVVQWMLTHSFYPRDVYRVIFKHFDKFSADEQLAICDLLVQRYQYVNNGGWGHDTDWFDAIDCLRRCSSLDAATIDELVKIFKKRNYGGGMLGVPPEDVDVSSDRFAKLLGVTLPPLENSAPFSHGPLQVAPFKGSLPETSQPPTTKDDNINAWVKASESTDKPLFRGFPFDTWIKALESERSFDTQLLAGEAVLALAETPEQKYAAAKQVLRVSRSIDRRDNSEGSNNNKWVRVLFPNIFGLLPDPFLKAAIEEIPQGNHNSILTIYYVALPIGDPASTGWNLPNAPQLATSPLWESLISELAHVKEPQELLFPQGQSSPLVDETLNLSSGFNIPFENLDPALQAESKRQWEQLLQTEVPQEPIDFRSRNLPPQAWLPYWLSLPQTDNHKLRVMQAIFFNINGARRQSRRILAHIENYTPQELTEVCKLLVDRYDMFDFEPDKAKQVWDNVFDSLHRDGKLGTANLENAFNTVCKLLNTYTSETGYQHARNSAKLPPQLQKSEFHKLLDSPYGDKFVDPSQVKQPSQTSSLKNPNNTDAQSATKDDNINTWVQASASSSKTLFRGFDFDSWLKTLENERDAKAQLAAGEAVLTLAESPEQMTAAASAILKASRVLGGVHSQGNRDDYSAQWMAMLLSKFNRFILEPFLAAATKELPQANLQSVYAILTMCRKAAKEQLLEANTNSTETSGNAYLRAKLVQQLSSFENRVRPTLKNEIRQYLLSEICALTDHIDMPYVELDAKLQKESKQLWEAAVGKALFYNMVGNAEFGTPWMPYWLTIPQNENQKSFMVRAVFANLDRAQMDSQKVFEHFDKFTPEQQSEICEFLCERSEDFWLTSWNNIEMWQHMFDCLRRCSTIDKSNINEAFKIITDMRAECEFNLKMGGIKALKSLDAAKFRQLLGVPAKIAANNTAGTSAPKPNTNKASQPQPASQDAELDTLMSNSGSGKALFRGYGFDAWIKALDADRSGEMQLQAGEAVITLAENPEEKLEAARAVLRKSRELGGYILSNEDFTLPWLNLLQGKIRKLFPKPFLTAAIDEMKHNNAKSMATILWLCTSGSNGLYFEQLLANGDKTIDRTNWKTLLMQLSRAAEGFKKKTQPDSQNISQFILSDAATLAGRLDIDYRALELPLQEESRRSWESALKKPLPVPSNSFSLPQSQVPSVAPWLPYWKTLPPEGQHKVFVAKAILQSTANSNGLYSKFLTHFGPFTSEEQAEFCNALVEKYQANYDRGSDNSDCWQPAFDCLRRCSTIAKSNVDEGESVVNDFKTLLREWRSTEENIKARLQLSPERIARLLNVPYPLAQPTAGKPSKQSNADQAKNQGTDSSAAPNVNTQSSGTKDNDDDSWVKASESTDKPLFRGHSFITWSKALQNERSVPQQLLAGEAVIATADTPDQKLQAVKLILEKSRELGGHFIGDNNDSQKWMSMLRSKIYRLFPEPFLQAAVEEVKQGNEKSLLAIFSICRGAAAEQLVLEKDSRWPNLINALAQESSRKSIKVSGIWEGSNYILAETLSLADRIPIPFSELDPILQAESKRLWESALKNDMPMRPMYGYAKGTPWIPYWKSLPQSNNHKAFIVRALIVNLDGVQASSQEILDHLATFTPEEQTAVCQTLLERYSQSDFRYPNSDRIWNQIFDCLRRCSSLDKASIDKAAELVTNARALAAANVVPTKAYGSQDFSFPIEVAPAILDRLLGHPFGKPDSEGVAPPLPTPYWNKPETPTFIRPETSGGVF